MMSSPSGGVHCHHQDLGPGLGEQGGIHGVDMLHGAVRQHPGVVVDIGVAAHHGGGRLFPDVRFFELSDGDAGRDGQDQHHRRHSPSLKKSHRRMSSLPLSRDPEKGLGENLRSSPADPPPADQEIPIMLGRARPRAASSRPGSRPGGRLASTHVCGRSPAPAGQFTFRVCRTLLNPCAFGAHTPVSDVTGDEGSAAQPLAALPLYGCGAPFAGRRGA